MLGDQPGVTRRDGGGAARRPRRRAAGGLPLRRRPRAPDRVRAAALFGELAGLHGDKGVWRLLDRRAATTSLEVPIAGPIPLDVDTEEDYGAVLASAASVA